MAREKSRRPVRPFVRPTLQSSQGLRGAAARLAASAGGTSRGAYTERATIDALEPKKMLYTVTVGSNDIDPTTGWDAVARSDTSFVPLPKL